VGAIQALCSLLEAKEPIARWDLVARFGGAAIRALEAGGLATPGSSLSVVRCQLCDAGHIAAVYKSEEGFGYHCVAEGCEGVVAPDALATLMVDPAAILVRLRSSIGRWRDGSPARRLVPHRLWRLGEGQLADNRSWTCFLALQAIDGAIIEAIERDTGPQGLVIAAAASPLFAEIASHRIVGLADIADVDQTGELRVEARAIESALGMRSMGKRGAGRPPAGLAEALTIIPALSDQELMQPTADILRSLRSRGVPFSEWKVPPETLVTAFEEQVAAERHHRGLAE
jgi:hypothetical protein